MINEFFFEFDLEAEELVEDRYHDDREVSYLQIDEVDVRALYVAHAVVAHPSIIRFPVYLLKKAKAGIASEAQNIIGFEYQEECPEYWHDVEGTSNIGTNSFVQFEATEDEHLLEDAHRFEEDRADAAQFQDQSDILPLLLGAIVEPRM